MRSDLTGHITSSEWRWVILISTVLVALAFLPFLWVLVAGLVGSSWQFMGALHDYQNSAVSLAHLFEASTGRWLTHFSHTAEPHDGAFLAPVYVLLGQVARITSLSPIVIFHVARVGAALTMYIALYQLGAQIWMRIRSRRIFFVVAAVGSGLGWLLLPITQTFDYLDVFVPSAFPFYSSLVNVHFPLAIACLASLSGLIVILMRPGNTISPSVENGGAIIFLLGLALVLVYPVAFIPFTLALILNVIWHGYKQRQVPMAKLRWLLWFIVPTLPLLAYDLSVLNYNPVAWEVWIQGNSAAPPSVWVFSLSLGLPLLLALPGLYRAFRRFEPDGDQFMLLWLVVMIALVYLPTRLQREFVVGIMIPLAYFVTRSLEDFWFNLISRPWRLRLMAAAIPLIGASNLFVLFLPLQPISANNFESASGLLLQRDYLVAFEWLRLRGDSTTVVLAAPEVGLWLPVWTDTRPVYGHSAATVNPIQKRQAVESWYRQTELARCQALLEGAFGYDGREYQVRYILYGPQEAAIGQPVCLEPLPLIQSFGSIRIYLYTPGAYALSGP